MGKYNKKLLSIVNTEVKASLIAKVGQNGETITNISKALEDLEKIRSGKIQDREATMLFAACASTILKQEVRALDPDAGLTRTKYVYVNRYKSGNKEKSGFGYLNLRSRMKTALKRHNITLRSFVRYNAEEVEQYWSNFCNKTGLVLESIKNKNSGLTKSLCKVKGRSIPINYTYSKQLICGTQSPNWFKNIVSESKNDENIGVQNSLFNLEYKSRVNKAMKKVKRFFGLK